jgi:hypothetical protein
LTARAAPITIEDRMGESERGLPMPAVFRAALLALGAVQTGLGLYALISPSGFYRDFPFGRGWVELLPAYNEHLVRDVGGLFLLSGAVLLAAGVLLGRQLVAVALASFLLYSVPHTVYHYLNFGPFETPDVIANVIGLGAQVVIPVALLVVLWRVPAAGRSETAGAGRIGPAPGSGIAR